jgi:DNA-binding CsgD family transcriptional regulator
MSLSHADPVGRCLVLLVDLPAGDGDDVLSAVGEVLPGARVIPIGGPDGHRMPTGAGNLTVRECQVAVLLMQGMSNKEIATRLCIEVATVKNHVHHILAKLHVRRRGEAVARLAFGRG